MHLYDTLPPHVQAILARFQAQYNSALESSTPILTQGLDLVRQSKGKQLRPLLLILTASALGCEDDRITNAAVFVELLHASTLVHDDVLDESDTRRGRPTPHAMLGDKKAVLLGDYMLCLAIKKALETQDLRVINTLSSLGQALTEGEFQQMHASAQTLPTRQEYYQIIRSKTASLIATCFYLGGLLSGKASETELKTLQNAGEMMGMAFQMKDDVLDYTSSGQRLGKPVLNDLREHKITLPLLCALEKNAPGREHVVALLQQHPLEEFAIATIHDYVLAHDGITEAEAVLQEYAAQGKQLLMEALPHNDSLQALLSVCNYMVTREH